MGIDSELGSIKYTGVSPLFWVFLFRLVRLGKRLPTSTDDDAFELEKVEMPRLMFWTFTRKWSCVPEAKALSTESATGTRRSTRLRI
jgi:hypothetical protein